MYDTVAEFRFGSGGNGIPHLIEGWAKPDSDSVWSVGNKARLRIPVEPFDGDLMLQLLISPYVVRPFHNRQTVEVAINGIAQGTAMVMGEAALGYTVPREVLDGTRHLEIALTLPDAVRPADAGASDDQRQLGIALVEALAITVAPEPPCERQILPPLPIPAFPSPQATAIVRGFTGLTPSELAMQFESLGFNCDFGFLQATMGAEPLGLLRFGSTSMHRLLRGLDLEFPGIDDTEKLRVWYDPSQDPEYLVHHDIWSLQTHTRRFVGEIEPEDLRREEARRLGFLRRMLFENLRDARKLLIYQSYEPLTETLMLPLLTTLRTHGRNALLFVCRNDTRPPGTVERLRTGLYFGSMDKHMRPQENSYANLPAWLSICANAYRLWRLDGGGAEA